METESTIINPNDEQANIYEYEGYTVEIEYTPGRTMYQCMASVIKRMNEKLTILAYHTDA